MKIKTVYLEEQVKDHSNTQKILKKIKYENIILCEHYSEVFNTTKQNFRIQKKNPAIILAKKTNNFMFKTPKDFTIGYKNNFYFSHLINCPYDCKYCYLQGMFNSANFLLFVNYEDFLISIKEKINNKKETTCFFSGYDCDSLALENITCFLDSFIPHFKELKNAVLEIRSKSININVLKKRRSLRNVIPAFSLNPEFVIKNFEDKTPSLEKRLIAIKNLQKQDWNIGLRFDPLIWAGAKKDYKAFFNNVFNFIDVSKVHSVTLGSFRMPKKYLKKISKLKPNDYFLQRNYIRSLFNLEKNEELMDQEEFCIREITKFISKEKFFNN